MSIVIDANLLVTLVSGDSRRELVLTQFEQWIDQNTPLHAPELARYEIANSLTRLIVAGQFSTSALPNVFEYLDSLPITYHPLSQSHRVVEIALSLHRQNSYDAAYLALAEALNTEVWTLDGSLYRNAVGQGLPVRLLGE